jgi:PAS domain S-box-containing protein
MGQASCKKGLMSSAPIPKNDAERLATLHSYAILDSPPEQGYEDVTAFATYVCATPYSTITFVDKDRQWFKSEVGFGTNETGRSDGFCACAILHPETLIVEDTLLDPRFSNNPFVLGGPQIRFYAGAPIVAPNGHLLGTVCVFDDKPRQLSSAQIGALESLARQVLALLEQRSTISRLEAALAVSKEAERRLGELAAIVESSDDVILSKDLNGTITSWNPAAAAVFGYTAEEIVGTSVLKLIPESLKSEEKTIIENIRAGKRIEHFETQRITRNGDLIDVSLTISPVRDSRGEVVGASKILRNISGRKRIEESLLQAEKIAAAGRMASTIAHEVNNPLEAITNLLYLLRPHVIDPAGTEYLATAESEIARVSHIAKQTLGFYREQTAANCTLVSELLKHAIAIYEPRCATNGITIEKSLDSTRELVLRRGEMMQVVSNLIANSMYAMPSGGTLSISVEDAGGEDDGVVVTIRDTGVGIAAHDIPKVFDAFFTTRSAIGTGIGLFVAKDFVEGHGGRIELASNQACEQHGTTVRIHLPLRTAYDPTRAR